FHDPERDRERDQRLCDLGVRTVLRFTGAEIVRDANACAGKVCAHLSSLREDAGRYTREANLDASQLLAVSHHLGPARVLAPAGAGKTKTMLNRVVELLDRGVPADRILVLAFNRKAADQLEERLGDLRVPLSKNILGGGGVTCATFHAFGFR